MKNKGGRVQLLLTRNPTKDFYPERPSGVKDLSSNPKIANSGPTGKEFYPEEHRDEGSLLLFVAQPLLAVLFQQSPVTSLLREGSRPGSIFFPYLFTSLLPYLFHRRLREVDIAQFVVAYGSAGNLHSLCTNCS